MNLIKVSEDTVVNILEIIALNHQGVALFANGQTLKLSVEAAERIVDYCPDLPARKPATSHAPDIAQIRAALEAAEHEIACREGLMAFDGAAPAETFEIKAGQALTQVRQALALMPSAPSRSS